jgi:hypothetical protein
VNTHHDDILDVTLFKQVVKLLALIGDRILFCNLNRLNLAALWSTRLAGGF